MLTVRTSENTVITSFRLISERQDFSSVRTGENTVRARARIQHDPTTQKFVCPKLGLQTQYKLVIKRNFQGEVALFKRVSGMTVISQHSAVARTAKKAET